jgi:hypothetical protein
MNKKRTDVIDRLAESFKPTVTERAERTTFKLGEEALADLEWVSDQEGRSIRAVLDGVIEYFFSDGSDNEKDSTKEMVFFEIVQMAQAAQPFDGVRKSFAIGYAALRTISTFSEKSGIERDRLLNYMIKTYREILEKNIRNKIQHKKTALSKLKKMLECWNNLSQQEIDALHAGGESDATVELVDNLGNELNALVAVLDYEINNKRIAL